MSAKSGAGVGDPPTADGGSVAAGSSAIHRKNVRTSVKNHIAAYKTGTRQTADLSTRPCAYPAKGRRGAASAPPLRLNLNIPYQGSFLCFPYKMEPSISPGGGCCTLMCAFRILKKSDLTGRPPRWESTDQRRCSKPQSRQRQCSHKLPSERQPTRQPH